MTQDSWKSLIASLPSGLSYSEAADRLGLDYQSVRQAIRRYRYQAIDGRKFSQDGRRKFDPDKADWTKSNQWNAIEQKCSRELVRRYRNRLQKPFVESRGRKSIT